MTNHTAFAVDTSTISAFYAGDLGKDVSLFREHLLNNTVVLPPPVLMEALSNHRSRDQVARILSGIELLEIKDGYWLRASELRAKVLKHGLKAKTADTLIAQCCIDHNVPLITRDVDFKHYAKYGGLKLA
jgi:predicted nucleic acid-binding protein